MTIPDLEVITDNLEVTNTRTLKEIIEERKMLKTRFKLLQISAFDKDLINLHNENLSLSSLNLEDFHLTERHNLFVPIKNKIIEKSKSDSTKLKSYLIYLSYLYNFDFLNTYYKNPNELYRIIFSLKISEEIKQSLFTLLENKDSEYFSIYLSYLNGHEFRDTLREEELKLRRFTRQ